MVWYLSGRWQEMVQCNNKIFEEGFVESDWVGLHIYLKHNIDFYGNLTDTISDDIQFVRNERIGYKIVNTLSVVVNYYDFIEKLNNVCRLSKL